MSVPQRRTSWPENKMHLSFRLQSSIFLLGGGCGRVEGGTDLFGRPWNAQIINPFISSSTLAVEMSPWTTGGGMKKHRP